MVTETVERRCPVQPRSEPRMKMILPARLTADGREQDCQIRDMSRGGACIDSGEALAPGARILLTCGSMGAEGHVAWTRGRRAGIRFDAPIRATDLFVLMSRSRTA